jgi:hypothetical protein
MLHFIVRRRRRRQRPITALCVAAPQTSRVKGAAIAAPFNPRTCLGRASHIVV